MATYYARSTGGNWNSSSSWSTVSSASSTNAGTFPGAADTTILDSGSGNITINVASACLSLNTTGYTNTLTFNNNLTFSTNSTLTLGSSTTVAADLSSRRLQLGANIVVTSNGVYLPITINVAVGTTNTYYFADDFDCLNAGVNAGVNFNGNFLSNSTTTRKFKIRGDFYSNAIVNSSATNTVIFTFTGTGTFSSNNITMYAPIEINTSGTITFSAITHGFNNNGIAYSCSLRYVLGTVISTNATFNFTGSAVSFKIDSNTLVFNNIICNGNMELLSTLRATTINFLYNSSALNHTLSGNFGMICDYLEFNKSGTLGAYRNLTLTAGNTYIVNKLISNFPIPNTALTAPTIQSSHATNKVALTLNGGSNLIKCSITRVDASGGVIINTIGTITNCSNVGTSTQNILI
jgi:hypothetical protein